MRKYAAWFGALVVGIAAAGAASAHGNPHGPQTPQPPQAPPLCADTDITPTALNCSGFYTGNLLDHADIAAQETGLSAIGFTWDGDWSSITKIDNLNGATTLNFGAPVSGITFIGIHFGGANGDNGTGAQSTAFYKLDAGSGLSTIGLNLGGSSDAVLYSTSAGAPEPATWGLLIAGAGLAGVALRRRRTLSAA